jgi:curved DNA-binding protein CbpA
MAELPDYYCDLGVQSTANQQEIQKVYQRRISELRGSHIEDSPEELAEVEAAYAVLGNPGKRADYDAKLQRAESDQDKNEAEMDAYLQSQHRRSKRNRRTGSWIDAILDLFFS